MDIAAIMQHFGGPALFVLAWLEGEAAVIMGGAFARAGYWPWWAVWLIAAVPATAGHQIYWWLGRRYGAPLAARLAERWGDGVRRATELVRRHERTVLLSMRFAYGIRLPLPILCGVAGVPGWRFFRYALGTALLWSFLFTALGYAFGTAATAAFHNVAHAESLVLLGSVAFATAVTLVVRWIGRRRAGAAKNPPAAPADGRSGPPGGTSPTSC